MSEHTTSWEDGGIAGVATCGGVAIRELDFYVNDEYPTECPRCGKWLKLKWDVRIEELEPSDE